MRLLHRYVFSSILGATLIVALAIAAISAVLALLDELEQIEAGGYNLMVALQLVALQLPRGVNELFPIIVLLGAILGLGGLASGSELVAMRASGVSLARLTASVLRASLLLALVSVFIGEWLAPRAEDIGQQIRAAYNLKNDRDSAGEGVWWRDGDSYIRIGTVVGTQLLEDVHIYRFGPDRRLQLAAAAESARFDDGRWQLFGVNYSEFETQRVKSYQTVSMEWNTGLKPDLLQVSVMSPERQTMQALYQYVRYLESYRMEAGHYKIALWSKAAVPVMILVMAVLAIPFVIGPLRTTGAGQRMFVGMLVGVVFFLFNELTQSTGQVYGLSPLLSAWLPTGVLCVISLGWLTYLNWPAPILRSLNRLRAA